MRIGDNINTKELVNKVLRDFFIIRHNPSGTGRKLMPKEGRIGGLRFEKINQGEKIYSYYNEYGKRSYLKMGRDCSVWWIRNLPITDFSKIYTTKDYFIGSPKKTVFITQPNTVGVYRVSRRPKSKETFMVYLCRNREISTVTVRNPCLDHQDTLLKEIYYDGRNRLSVNDVIFIDDDAFLILKNGFMALTKEEFNNYKKEKKNEVEVGSH